MQKHKHKCKQNFILVLGLKLMLASTFSWSNKDFCPCPGNCEEELPKKPVGHMFNTSPVKQGMTCIKGK